MLSGPALDLVQSWLRLRLVPIRPRCDVLQLRLEEIVQELLLRILHLREDLARGRRADAIDGVRVDSAFPVDGNEVRYLFRAREQLSFLIREVEFPRPFCVCVSNGPRSPPQDRQKARFAFRALRMVRHLTDPDLRVEVSALEAQEVD